MRRENNKGYSLIELILTIAIFSIIMLAIIMMMRTTLASYREGLLETNMQEEAQIVANQVGDLLIDANSFSDPTNGVLTDLEGHVIGNRTTYAFNGPDGDFDIYYDVYSTGEKELRLKHDVREQLLSDMIDSFTIDNMVGRPATETTPAAPFDNTVDVIVDIKNKDKTYSATKKVYFRNNIEDSKAYDIEYSGSAEKTDPDEEKPEDLEVVRFKPLDISSDYGIIYDAKIYPESQTVFVLKDADKNIVKTKLSDDATPKQYFIDLNSTYKTVAGLTMPSVASDDSEGGVEYYVEGKDYNGNVLKYRLHVDPVSFEIGSGVVQQYLQKDVNSGYPSIINVKGINMLGAKDALNITYDVEFYNGAGNKKIAESKNNGLGVYEAGQDPQSVNALDQGLLPEAERFGVNSSGNKNSGTEYKIGIFADSYSNGLIITPPNGMNAKYWYKYLTSDDGTQEIRFTVHFKPKTGSGEYIAPPIREHYYLVGTSLKNANKALP